MATVSSPVAKSRSKHELARRPVWVGGGRRGDGIVIAANRHAKKFGIKTGMACFEAKRLCPRGVLCRPHYDEYRRISAEMFHVLEQYSPTLVPISIDEGFLDFTTMDKVVWRNTTPEKYVGEICERISREVKIPVSAGLGQFLAAWPNWRPMRQSPVSSKSNPARKRNF